MKYQYSLRKTVLATILLSGSVFALPTLAHQNIYSNNYHFSRQSGANPNGSIGLNQIMEKMGSTNMSMMMGKDNGVNMMRWMSVTDLTDDQQSRINNLHDSMRKSHWELVGAAMEERANLRDAMAIDRPDSKEVGEIYGRLFDLKRKAVESRIETHNGVLDLLSDEQAEQMKSSMMMSGRHNHGKNQGSAKLGS